MQSYPGILVARASRLGHLPAPNDIRLPSQHLTRYNEPKVSKRPPRPDPSTLMAEGPLGLLSVSIVHLSSTRHLLVLLLQSTRSQYEYQHRQAAATTVCVIFVRAFLLPGNLLPRLLSTSWRFESEHILPLLNTFATSTPASNGDPSPSSAATV